MRDRGEDDLIGRLRAAHRRHGSDLLGDDAAFLPGARAWAISVDQQIEGVHFPEDLPARLLGPKLVGACLSDLAACGARPTYALLTVALPQGYDGYALLSSVDRACRGQGVVLAGGDTASGVDRVSTSLTVLGARSQGGRWLRRDSARVGDRLWIGGTLGESALGRLLLQAGARVEGRKTVLPAVVGKSERLRRCARRAIRRHLAPAPQIDLGIALASRSRVAAIDVSDGLALDLHRLCRESEVGAEVEQSSIPSSPGLDELSGRLEERGEELTLSGGEDYVLLFTQPEDAPSPGEGCVNIGSISDRSAGVTLRRASGVESLSPSGWDHLAGPPATGVES